MNFVDIFNLVEAGWWILVAACLLVLGIRRSAARVHLLAASCLFFAFGASDLVEVKTGAWWRPWWLFVWKGLCLVGFVAIAAHYRWVTKQKQSSKTD